MQLKIKTNIFVAWSIPINNCLLETLVIAISGSSYNLLFMYELSLDSKEMFANSMIYVLKSHVIIPLRPLFGLLDLDRLSEWLY